MGTSFAEGWFAKKSGKKNGDELTARIRFGPRFRASRKQRGANSAITASGDQAASSRCEGSNKN